MVNKEDFQAYEEVRESGVTNMFDIRNIKMLSGLERDTIVEIIEQYSELCAKYPDIRSL